MFKIDLQEKNETTRILQIEVPIEEVEKEFSKVTQSVQKGAALPGFRKGRVPLDLISKKYSKEIHDEVMERLITHSYRYALEKTNSVPILQPRFENIMLDRGKSLTYQLTLEVLPKVKLGSYQGLKLKRKKIEISEAQISTVLEKLQKQNAVLTPITDRPVQSEDVTTIDFTGELDGKTVPGTHAENYDIEIGSGQTIPDFDRNIVGMNLHQIKTFSATFPTDYHAAEIAGRTIDFTVTLKSIREKKLPALDDDFAKELGAFGSLEDLKTRIRQDLEAEHERQNRTELKEQIMQQLGDMVDTKIPAILIKRSLDKLVHDHEQRMKEKHQTWEESGTSPEEIEKQNRSTVEFQLRANLALREISLLEKIEVSPEEINTEIKHLARMTRQSIQALKDYLKQTDRWEELRERLRDDKTIDWIIQNAQVSENKK